MKSILVGREQIIVLTGDFNAASHLDYPPSAASPSLPHPAPASPPARSPAPPPCASGVPWPSSLLLEGMGLKDSYFYAPSHDRPTGCGQEPEKGITWTPLPEEEKYGIFDRIDFVYYHPGCTNMEVVNSITLDGNYSMVPYPSDHRAVLSTFSFQ